MKSMIKANIYKYKSINGVYQRVRVSSREIKSFIQRVNKWDDITYRKQRDIFKNKLYRYYNVNKTPLSEQKSATHLLYLKAKTMKSLGAKYRPSNTMVAIESMTASSLTKTRKDVAKMGKSFNRSIDSIISSIDKSVDKIITKIEKSLKTKVDIRAMFRKDIAKYGYERAKQNFVDYLSKHHEKVASLKESKLDNDSGFSKGKSNDEFYEIDEDELLNAYF